MASAAGASAGGGMKNLLEPFFLTTAKVPRSRLVLTTFGRPLREHGVAKQKQAILEHGFMENFAPLVTLMRPLGADEELVDVLSDASTRLKVIDGNHRVAAMGIIDKDSGDGADTSVTVRVHGMMTKSTERMVAQAMNAVSSTVVEKTLVDDVIWYRSGISAIQQENSKELLISQLANKIKDEFNSMKQTPPAKATLTKYVTMALKFTEEGLEAFKDVTYLNGRPTSHPDHKLFDYKRVTIKMVTRDQFYEMNGCEQEAYVFRLAKGFVTHKILSKDECEKLDKEARDIGREVANVVQIAPRDKWSPGFAAKMRKLIVKEAPGRFYMHHDALEKKVAAYVKGLHAGMDASEEHKAMLLSQPQKFTQEALATDPAMSEFWTKYCDNKESLEKKVISDAVEFLESAKKDPKKAKAVDTAKAAKDATEEAEEATEEAASLTEKASEAAAAVSPACPAAAPAEAPTTASSSGSTSTASTTKASTTASTTSTAASSTGQSAAGAEDAPASETTATGKGTAGKTTGKTTGTKRKRTPAAETLEAKRAVADERLANLRRAVTMVQTVDVLSSSWDVAEDVLKVKDGSTMLAFFNIAVDASILNPADDCRERLNRVLVALHTALHPKGTLAIALETTSSLDFPYMEGRLKATGFVVEMHPIVSAYTAGQAGRVAGEYKNHHSRQLSLVLIAHKTGDFACYGRTSGTRRAQRGAASVSFKPPRQQVLEDIGIVLSTKHPESATFLSQAMADYLLTRFTVAGDSVLVTAFDENPIAPLVLGNGRTLCALVADISKKDDVDKAVDAACTDAMKHGWFAELSKANVIIRGSTLPSIVPENNLSEEAVARYWDSQEAAGADEETEETSFLFSARVFADEFNLEIKPSSIHGLGLFAVHDLPKGEAMPMPLMGHFEVHTPEEAFEMMLDDGVPRHPLLQASDFSGYLNTEEIASDDSTLWLKTSPMSFMYYMNSSFPNGEVNVTRAAPLTTNPPSKETVRSKLNDARNGIVFTTSRDLKAGEELLFHYPVPQAAEGAGGEGGSSAGDVGSPSRRSQRLRATGGSS